MSSDLEIVDPVGVEVRRVDPSALQERTKAHMAQLIEVAKRYPRSLQRFRDNAIGLATLTEEVAGDCIYGLPRGGKTIEGPSVRLAEIVANAWGNLFTEAFIAHEDRRYIVARANAWDLEANVMVGFEVRRRITDRSGETFSDDMIAVAANAAASIAFRNAVFKAVPSPVWRVVYFAARQAACGDASTLATRRANMLGYFAKIGADEERVLAALGVASVEEIGLQAMGLLRGIATAIKARELAVDDAFPAVGGFSGAAVPAETVAARSDQLAAKVLRARQARQAAEQQAAAAEASVSAPAALGGGTADGGGTDGTDGAAAGGTEAPAPAPEPASDGAPARGRRGGKKQEEAASPPAPAGDGEHEFEGVVIPF